MWDSDSHVIRLWSSWWLVGKSRNSHRPSALNQACSLKSNIESKSNNMVDPSCFLWKLGSFWSIKWGSLSPETTSCFSFFYPVELAKFLNLAMLFLATVSLSHAYPMYIIHKIMMRLSKKIRASPSGVHGYPPNRDAGPGPTHPTGSRKQAAGFLCLRFVLKENWSVFVWRKTHLDCGSLRSFFLKIRLKGED